MGLWTSSEPAISQQIASIPAFPEIYKLGSDQYDGWPLPIGEGFVQTNLLDNKSLKLLESQTLYKTYVAAIDGFDWFKRTGDSIGFIGNPSDNLGIFHKYLYFASKIKRNNLSKAYWGSNQYVISRTLIPSVNLETYRLDLFNENIQTQSNNSGGFSKFAQTSEGFDALENTLYPGQDSITNTYTLAWNVLFSESVSALGSETWGTLSASPQTWNKLNNLEIATQTNSVIVSAQIEALFPITTQTPDLDEAKRAYARKFAYPLEWSNQKRTFDESVLRQGEIPALNCIPIPSFETNVGGLIPKGDFRTAFREFGDFCAMAWTPCADDESSVWVLNRIRVPDMIPLPQLKANVVGLPDWFQGELLFLDELSTKPIVALNSNRTIGHRHIFDKKETGQLNGWNWYPFNTSYEQMYAKTANIGEFVESKQTVTNTKYFKYIQNKNILRTEPYSLSEIENLVLYDFCNLGSFPCIGFSKQNAMDQTPANMKFENVLFREEGDPPEIKRQSWNIQLVKVKETNRYMTLSSFGSSNDIIESLEAIEDWANDFYQNEDNYIPVGTYKWQDSDGNTLLEQEIWGNKKLISGFNITIDFS